MKVTFNFMTVEANSIPSTTNLTLHQNDRFTEPRLKAWERSLHISVEICYKKLDRLDKTHTEEDDVVVKL
jgi:hypothetical protein